MRYSLDRSVDGLAENRRSGARRRGTHACHTERSLSRFTRASKHWQAPTRPPLGQRVRGIAAARSLCDACLRLVVVPIRLRRKRKAFSTSSRLRSTRLTDRRELSWSNEWLGRSVSAARHLPCTTQMRASRSSLTTWSDAPRHVRGIPARPREHERLGAIDYTATGRLEHERRGRCNGQHRGR